MLFQYPLTMSFKIISWGPQISVADSSGREVMYVHQKALKLKEDINVYTDKSRETTLFNIKADRVIDFSAAYTITDVNGTVVGKTRRKGMRSIWKADYEIFDPADAPVYNITEDKPWVKVADAVISEIPLVGMIGGYIFHPSYTTRRGETSDVAQMTKQPAFFEGKFEFNLVDTTLPEDQEKLVVLSNVMMILLERMRG